MDRSGIQKRVRKGHAKLEPRVVYIPEASIRKKWKKLPAAHHSAARELILSTKQQSRIRRGKQGIDLATEECVQEVVNSLIEKVARIPYPPATDENYFDHEANIHRTRRIEEQLDSNTHSMSLLRAQLAKEEELLSQDKAELGYLEQSLKSNEALRRQRSRTLHPVARKIQPDHHPSDSLLIQGRHHEDPKPTLMPIFEDGDMLPVLDQLQSHLASMYNNTSSIQEVKQVVEHTSFELSALLDTPYAGLT